MTLDLPQLPLELGEPAVASDYEYVRHRASGIRILAMDKKDATPEDVLAHPEWWMWLGKNPNRPNERWVDKLAEPELFHFDLGLLTPKDFVFDHGFVENNIRVQGYRYWTPEDSQVLAPGGSIEVSTTSTTGWSETTRISVTATIGFDVGVGQGGVRGSLSTMFGKEWTNYGSSELTTKIAQENPSKEYTALSVVYRLVYGIELADSAGRPIDWKGRCRRQPNSSWCPGSLGFRSEWPSGERRTLTALYGSDHKRVDSRAGEAATPG